MHIKRVTGVPALYSTLKESPPSLRRINQLPAFDVYAQSKTLFRCDLKLPFILKTPNFNKFANETAIKKNFYKIFYKKKFGSEGITILARDQRRYHFVWYEKYYTEIN